MRKLILLLSLIVLTSGALSVTTGIYAKNNQKNIGSMETTFTIGIVNSEGSPINLTLSGRNTSVYRLSYPSSTIIQPSRPTTNPEGSGYFYIGDGQYLKKSEIEIKVEVKEYRPEINIPIEATAFRRMGRARGSLLSRTAYVRDFNFTLELDDSLKPIDYGRTEKEDDNGWRETSTEDLAERETETDSSEPLEPEDTGSKTYKPEQEQTKSGEGGINTVTMMLAAGILLTAVYILKVV